MAPKFGRLEPVDLRDAWPHEAHDFTPWLAKNLDRLTAVIGIEIKSIQTEAPVEQFSADILARNTMDDSVVLIENQLEWSDHTHLGQILTYLAGLEARTVIWVARAFQDAHLSAIRWLNENTTDSFNFFAVQVKVVKIGDSPLVPIFDVVERPSEWDRQVRAKSLGGGGNLSAIGEFREEFWAAYSERYPDDGIPRPRRVGNVYHQFPELGVHISQYLSQDSVGLWISKLHQTDLPQSTQELVAPYLTAIGARLEIAPEQLTYTAHRNFAIDAGVQENWPQAIDWLHKHLSIYRSILESAPAVPPWDADPDPQD